MPRSILIPILGLLAVILYGTTQAARPGAGEVPPPRVESERVEIREAPRSVHRPPPAAPRLRSEDEEASGARPDSARPAERDAAAPREEPPREAAGRDAQPGDPGGGQRD